MSFLRASDSGRGGYSHRSHRSSSVATSSADPILCGDVPYAGRQPSQRACSVHTRGLLHLAFSLVGAFSSPLFGRFTTRIYSLINKTLSVKRVVIRLAKGQSRYSLKKAFDTRLIFWSVDLESALDGRRSEIPVRLRVTMQCLHLLFSDQKVDCLHHCLSGLRVPFHLHVSSNEHYNW